MGKTILGPATEFTDEKTIHDPQILLAAKATENPPFTGTLFNMCKAPLALLETKDFKIYSRNGLTRDGVLGTTAWTKTATTGLSVKKECLNGLTIGHVLKVENEIVVIKAVDRSAGTIDVIQRGHGTGVAATHAAGVGFQTVGFAGRDEILHNVESCQGVTDVYENYVQTIFEIINWSKGAELKRQGLDEAKITAILLKEGQSKVNAILARIAIHGVRQRGDEDRDVPFMTAGLIEQLTDDCDGERSVIIGDDKGKAFNEETFRDNIQKVIDAGGAVDVVLVSPVMRNWFNSFDDSTLTTKQRGDHQAGTYITSYNYNGLIIDIEVDRDMPNNAYALLTRAKCFKGWLSEDGLKLVDENSLNSRLTRKSIQGSVYFAFEGVGKDHAWVKNVGAGTSKKILKVDNVGNGGTNTSE